MISYSGKEGEETMFKRKGWKISIFRIREVMKHTTSPDKGAFVDERQILGNISWPVNVESRLKSGVPVLVYLVDMKIAYDHVDWTSFNNLT